MPNVPDVMRAAALSEFGGPDNLSLEPVPVPELDPDEILIRVHTAGVGVWDPVEREGTMATWTDHDPTFPYILGSDGSGEVVAVGDRVRRFEVGDRVYATGFLNPKGGFYAEYAAVKAEHAHHIPDGISMEEAGAMPVDAVTALRGLRDELELKEDETLLVWGASGGVGHLAVQLANRMGARILAVASGANGVDMVRELGADEVVEGRDGDFTEPLRRLAPNGLDKALVLAQGERLAEALEAMHQGGRVAWPNGVTPEPQPPRGVAASSYDGRPDRDILDELNRLIQSGPFQVHVHRTFPLEAAAEAHRHLDEHFLGKLALHVEADEDGSDRNG